MCKGFLGQNTTMLPEEFRRGGDVCSPHYA